MLNGFVEVFPWLYACWVILILFRDGNAGTGVSHMHPPDQSDNDMHQSAFDTFWDDDLMSSHNDSSHSDDVCTSPAYSYLPCNIYHHDNFDLNHIDAIGSFDDSCLTDTRSSCSDSFYEYD